MEKEKYDLKLGSLKIGIKYSFMIDYENIIIKLKYIKHTRKTYIFSDDKNKDYEFDIHTMKGMFRDKPINASFLLYTNKTPNFIKITDYKDYMNTLRKANLNEDESIDVYTSNSVIERTGLIATGLNSEFDEFSNCEKKDIIEIEDDYQIHKISLKNIQTTWVREGVLGIRYLNSKVVRLTWIFKVGSWNEKPREYEQLINTKR